MNNRITLWLKEFIKSDLWILLLDIIAVNVSYLLALYLRFFVNGEFRASVGYYPEYFWRFAPYYTIVAIIVFALFKLYGGMWKYAGINDMNRIVLANVITAILQVVISIISLALLPKEERLASRMPFSYYVIGAILQFFFILFIRFSHKLLLVEKRRIANKKIDMIPAMVIGSGDLGRKVIHHLEDNTVYRAVAVAGKDSGRMMDGIPVISFDAVEKQIKEKGIKAIFVADKELNKDQRDLIQRAAEGLEINDFTGYMSNQSGFLPLTNLLDVMDMPVLVEVDGKEHQFSSSEECLSSLPGEYDVLRVQASKLVLRKREEDTSWMKVYQEQTGNEVSFF